MAQGFSPDTASDVAKRQSRRVLVWLRGPGLRAASAVTLTVGHQLRRNLVARRLLSLPHALVAIWVVILLWGEYWVFDGKVETCNWDHWEQWVSHRRRVAQLRSAQCDTNGRNHSLAQGNTSSPSGPYRRPSNNRPSFVSRPPLAALRADRHTHRQLPPTRLQGAPEPPAPGQRLFPR